MDNYYKVLYRDSRQKVVNTNSNRDFTRIFRFNELESYFTSISSYSSENKISIFDIINEIKNNTISNDSFNRLKLETKKKRFDWDNEGRYYYDYILERARKRIMRNSDLILPNRFNSNYFFESIEDCFVYIETKGPGVVAKIEIIEEKQLLKLDNSLLNYFPDESTSEDLMNYAEFFWGGGQSEQPIFEIMFEGKYRIIPF